MVFLLLGGVYVRERRYTSRWGGVGSPEPAVEDGTAGPAQPSGRVLHEDCDALGRQVERRLEPGADVPAVDGQFLHAQGEQLPRRAAAGLTRIGAEFVPIPPSELRQQGAELCIL